MSSRPEDSRQYTAEAPPATQSSSSSTAPPPPQQGGFSSTYVNQQQPQPPHQHQQLQNRRSQSFPQLAQQLGLPAPQSAPGSNMSYHFLPDAAQSHQFAQFPNLHQPTYGTDPSSGFYDVRASPRSFVPIAPDPVGVQRLQGYRGTELGGIDDVQSVQRQHSTGSTYRESPTPPTLRDEDRLLLRLKDEESLPWREIVARMSAEVGQNFQIPALQMRYRRLKDRMRVWTAQDVEALRKAYEYWETKKFEIIANKMQDFGVEEKWTPRAVQRKWNELNPGGSEGGSIGGDSSVLGLASRRSTFLSSSPQHHQVYFPPSSLEPQQSQSQNSHPPHATNYNAQGSTGQYW